MDGDHAVAIVATTNTDLGSMVIVQGDVPVHDSFCPVARLSDRKNSHTPHDVKARRPVPSGTFGEVDVLVRMLVMETSSRVMATTVTMPSTSGNILSRATVRQNVPSVAGVIPVMVIDDNLCVDAILIESRPEIILDYVPLSFPAEYHGWVSVIRVLGFVLKADGVNLNPFPLISLNEFDKVCGVGLLVVVAMVKLTSEKRIGCLHPSRRCPGGGNDPEAGVDFQGLFDDGNDEILVFLNGEAIHVKVIVLPWLKVIVGIRLNSLKVSSSHWKP